MIHALYFTDRQVKQKLFSLVKVANKLLLVSAVPPYRVSENPAELEPFATLEEEFAEVLDQVLVIDEGKAEGMWRDPLGDLGDALYPGDAVTSAKVARGYCLIERGQPRVALPRLGTVKEDERALRQAISRALSGSVPPTSKPPPTRKPSSPRRPNPYQVLGLTPGCTLAQAKKAYRALLVQYHPDKVEHLAEEFQALARTRTQAINEAWEAVCAELQE